MRQKHLKFHAASIAVICTLIIVLYYLFGPTKPGPTEEVVGDRFITIDNATWGKNCDAFVDQALLEYRLPAEGEKATPRPVHAERNNVLEFMARECNNKLSCRVLATADTFQIDPLASCFKRLTVGYRCFSYDRLHSVEIGQGEALVLNCRENAPTAQ